MDLTGAGLAQHIAIRLRAGRPGFDRWQEQETFLLSTATIQSLGPTQPPIQWVPGALSTGVKRQGREADHSLPPSADVKNSEAIPPLPRMCS
jgi:hypothetical protein